MLNLNTRIKILHKAQTHNTQTQLVWWFGGCLGALGHSLGALGMSLGALKCSWGVPGGSLGALGCSLGLLGCFRVILGNSSEGCCEALGVLLGAISIYKGLRFSSTKKERMQKG